MACAAEFFDFNNLDALLAFSSRNSLFAEISRDVVWLCMSPILVRLAERTIRVAQVLRAYKRLFRKTQAPTIFTYVTLSILAAPGAAQVLRPSRLFGCALVHGDSALGGDVLGAAISPRWPHRNPPAPAATYLITRLTRSPGPGAPFNNGASLDQQVCKFLHTKIMHTHILMADRRGDIDTSA